VASINLADELVILLIAYLLIMSISLKQSQWKSITSCTFNVTLSVRNVQHQFHSYTHELLLLLNCSESPTFTQRTCAMSKTGNIPDAFYSLNAIKPKFVCLLRYICLGLYPSASFNSWSLTLYKFIYIYLLAYLLTMPSKLALYCAITIIPSAVIRNIRYSFSST